jgi:DNA repair protein RecO (recombination protein O)
MDLAEGKRNRFITQAQPLSSYRGLRTDFERLSFALALCELYAAVVPVEEPEPEAYDLLSSSLAFLERHEKPLTALVWAEAALLAMGGFQPELEACVVTGEAVAVANPFLSPTAGGFVSEAASVAYPDRFRVRAEVVYGLRRLFELAEPPGRLKFADESLAALFPFWRYIAEMALPANESVVAEVTHGERLGNGG